MSETTVTREDRAAADHWATRLGMRGDDADDLAREFAALRERAEAAERERDVRGEQFALAGREEDALRARLDAAHLARDIATADRDTAQRDAAAARADAERLRAIVADAEDLCLEIPLEGMAGSRVFPPAAALLKRINADPAARTTESEGGCTCNGHRHWPSDGRCGWVGDGKGERCACGATAPTAQRKGT